MRSGASSGALEFFEVGNDLPGIAPEDGAADDPEERAEDQRARIVAECALPHHLDPAAAAGRQIWLPDD
jgi:hypothetical protein